MLEIILEKRIIYVLVGIFAAMGVVSKCVSNVALKNLVRAAGNMSKSTHPLMRLVRAKFEHACMVSEKVVNVRVFVDKYLYEYRVMGVRLYSLRRMENVSAVCCLVLGLLGAALEYSVNGMQEQVIRTGATGATMAVLLYLFHLTTDDNFRLEMAYNYMVDYLENVCLHKYEKAYQKELKVMAQRERNGAVEENDIEDAFEISDENPIEDSVPERMEPIQEVPAPRQGAEVPQPGRMDHSRTSEIPQPVRTPEPVQPMKSSGATQSVRTSEKAQPVRAAESLQSVKSMKKDQKKTENEEHTPVIRPERSDRDAMIRQILEEFMA